MSVKRWARAREALVVLSARDVAPRLALRLPR